MIKYRIRTYNLFTVALLALIIFSCEKKSDNVIDPNYSAPLLSNVYKSRDTVNTTSFSPVIHFNTSIDVNSNGGSEINSVFCKLYDSKNNLLGEFQMFDNGVSPDSVQGDNRYSCDINIGNISCLLVGQYSVIYSAENKDGITGNVINSFIYVRNTSNFPPIISDPIIPDTVVRPLPGQFKEITLQINVKDTNGICDINSVFFDAYRPSGNFIVRAEMIPMGNNIWKYTNTVGASVEDSSYGYFKYFFQAVDNSNAGSIIYKDSILFVRP